MRLMIRAAGAVALLVAGVDGASAQYGGPPEVGARYDYSGSAVCPEGYDFVRGRCVARWAGYGRRRSGYGEVRGGYADSDRGYGGGGVRPQWNRLGSAVCPDGYDYYAERNRCLPQ